MTDDHDTAVHGGLYLIQAYLPSHNGRTRDHYVAAPSQRAAVTTFRADHPHRVIRNMWQIVQLDRIPQEDPE